MLTFICVKDYINTHTHLSFSQTLSEVVLSSVPRHPGRSRGVLAAGVGAVSAGGRGRVLAAACRFVQCFGGVLTPVSGQTVVLEARFSLPS